MIEMVLFDLDGTLLPMDQDIFTKAYFQRLAAKLAAFGYDPKKLIDGIWAGTAAMVKNDGSCTNEQTFWNCAVKIFGDKILEDKPVFEEYYQVEFQEVAAVCGRNPLARSTVDWIKQKGYRVALATNPIFPAVATESRIRWVGLEPEDFELYTTYENTCYCKPNPDYFRDVARRLNLEPQQCLMVGNDGEEDTAAAQAGMKVFLLTDCLINKKERDLTSFPQGDFTQLRQYIEQL